MRQQMEEWESSTKALEEEIRRRKSLIAQEDDAESSRRGGRGPRGKGMHWQEKAIEDMTDKDWKLMRDEFEIKILNVR